MEKLAFILRATMSGHNFASKICNSSKKACQSHLLLLTNIKLTIIWRTWCITFTFLPILLTVFAIGDLCGCILPFQFESINQRITDSIKSPYHKTDQVVSRFFMKKFVIVASKQVPIADITREKISPLLKIPNLPVHGMAQCHYLVGLGRRWFRYPSEEEVNLVRATGQVIAPDRHIQSFKKVCIHGTEYKIRTNKRTKFCNFIVFSKDTLT